MSFHKSGAEFNLYGDRLSGYLLRSSNGRNYVQFSLNTVLGNDNGRFVWGGTNGLVGAGNTRLHRSWSGGEVYLRATLKNNAGNEVYSEINLSDRLGNSNGNIKLEPARKSKL